MVSHAGRQSAALWVSLHVVRIIAEHHGGTVSALNRLTLAEWLCRSVAHGQRLGDRMVIKRLF